jgi:hypothetical protein
MNKKALSQVAAVFLIFFIVSFIIVIYTVDAKTTSKKITTLEKTTIKDNTTKAIKLTPKSAQQASESAAIKLKSKPKEEKTKKITPTGKAILAQSQPIPGVYIRLVLSEKKLSDRTSFEIVSSETLSEDYEYLVRSTPDSDYSMTVYDSSSTPIDTYYFGSGRMILYDTEDDSLGGFFEFPSSVDTIYNPYNPAISSISLSDSVHTSTFSFTPSSPPPVSCTQENNTGDFEIPCCQGLMTVPYSETSFACVKCGDNQCSFYESSSTCPEDCKEQIYSCGPKCSDLNFSNCMAYGCKSHCEGGQNFCYGYYLPSKYGDYKDISTWYATASACSADFLCVWDSTQWDTRWPTQPPMMGVCATINSCESLSNYGPAGCEIEAEYHKNFADIPGGRVCRYTGCGNGINYAGEASSGSFCEQQSFEAACIHSPWELNCTWAIK